MQYEVYHIYSCAHAKLQYRCSSWQSRSSFYCWSKHQTGCSRPPGDLLTKTNADMHTVCAMKKSVAKTQNQSWLMAIQWWPTDEYVWMKKLSKRMWFFFYKLSTPCILVSAGYIYLADICRYSKPIGDCTLLLHDLCHGWEKCYLNYWFANFCHQMVYNACYLSVFEHQRLCAHDLGCSGCAPAAWRLRGIEKKNKFRKKSQVVSCSLQLICS